MSSDRSATTGPQTILELLEGGEVTAPALTAPGRAPLTYGELRRHVETTVSALNRHGAGRGDTVAVVLPNGPEMASAFIAVASGATIAPLNPAYKRDEFEYYLSDLDAKLLLVASGDETAARGAAKSLGIGVAELASAPGAPAGLFSLSGPAGAPDPAQGGYTEAGDAALVLHTSGTTSRPKIVPLTQANLCASAAHIRESLALVPGDRCLNIMPLFHIHGLIGAVLSSLSAGASVFCTPGFSVRGFFGWMTEAKPSWYTAVPTMHQRILSRAPENQAIIEAAGLRFIRSSSASLPPQVMRALEDTFHVPVIESYGMTEAAHQMASNPLPPRARKPGTVGVAAGPEVSVMDKGGRHLPAGTPGEIVIRGPNVSAGYRNNPEANATAFTDGWFRTGDEGVMDEEGYLRLTGRLKEVINRGGEKIMPREVDEVLLDHPAVDQALTFAMPHEDLGEEVAAAVVLKEDATATEEEIRDFAGTRLADFKVPKRLVFLDEIPKGSTGKLQRIGLAEKLGLV